MVYTARDKREWLVCFVFAAEVIDLPPDRPWQIALVRQCSGHLGWEAPRLLQVMEDVLDFYLGIVGQVRVPRWTKDCVHDGLHNKIRINEGLRARV